MQESWPQPNVVIVIVDALRADHLPVYGYARDTAPFLTKLAQNAVVFENCFTNAHWTRPAFPSLLLSQNVFLHGQELGSLATEMLDRIPEGAITLQEEFTQAGYRSVAMCNPSWWIVDLGWSRGFVTAAALDSRLQNLNFQETYTQDPLVAKRVDEMLISIAIEEAGKASQEDRPLFAFMHLLGAHHPWETPPEYRDRFVKPEQLARYEAAYGPNAAALQGPVSLDIAADWEKNSWLKEFLLDCYDAAICFEDDLLKRLMANMPPNTVFIVASDHGELFWDDFPAQAWRHAPDGRSCYMHGPGLHPLPGLLRVPLLVSWPGRLAASRRPEVVSLLDLGPTALALAGRPVPEGFQGRPLLSEDAPDRAAPAVIIGRGYPFSGVEIVDSQLRLYSHTPLSSREDIHFLKAQGAEEAIYDLRADPDCAANLAPTSPQLLEEFRRVCAAQVYPLRHGYHFRIQGKSGVLSGVIRADSEIDRAYIWSSPLAPAALRKGDLLMPAGRRGELGPGLPARFHFDLPGTREAETALRYGLTVKGFSGSGTLLVSVAEAAGLVGRTTIPVFADSPSTFFVCGATTIGPASRRMMLEAKITTGDLRGEIGEPFFHIEENDARRVCLRGAELVFQFTLESQEFIDLAFRTQGVGEHISVSLAEGDGNEVPVHVWNGDRFHPAETDLTGEMLQACNIAQVGGKIAAPDISGEGAFFYCVDPFGGGGVRQARLESEQVQRLKALGYLD